MFSKLSTKRSNPLSLFCFTVILLGLMLMMSCSSSTNNSDTDGSISISQPAAGDTLLESSVLIKAETTGEVMDGVKFYLDDNPVAMYIDNTAPYEYNCQLLFYIADGNTHSISVEALIGDANRSDSISVIISEEAHLYSTLFEPENNAEVQNPIQFRWESLPDAYQYEIEVKKLDSSFSPIFFSEDTTLTISIPDSAGFGLYEWKVRGESFSLNGQTSAFCPPSQFTLVESTK